MRKLTNLIAVFLAAFAELALATRLGGQRDVYFDVPLSNFSVMAFSEGTLVGPRLFPVVPVDKQSGVYPVITQADWLRLPQSTARPPKTVPRKVQFGTSSDSYGCINRALVGDNALEDLSNADRALMLRRNTARFVVSQLARDMEVRIANLVSSISNVGSGVTLAAGSRWSNYSNSSPISDVRTAHAFIRNNTGVRANTLLLDYDTAEMLRTHPELLDLYKYTEGGILTDAQIASALKVGNLIIADAIRENSLPDGTSSITNIWGNTALLCFVNPAAAAPETVTFGLGFRWQPEGVPAAMQARTYMDPHPGAKAEIVEVGYYQDEKIVARNLSYTILSTL